MKQQTQAVFEKHMKTAPCAVLVGMASSVRGQEPARLQFSAALAHVFCIDDGSSMRSRRVDARRRIMQMQGSALELLHRRRCRSDSTRKSVRLSRIHRQSFRVSPAMSLSKCMTHSWAPFFLLAFFEPT